MLRVASRSRIVGRAAQLTWFSGPKLEHVETGDATQSMPLGRISPRSRCALHTRRGSFASTRRPACRRQQQRWLESLPSPALRCRRRLQSCTMRSGHTPITAEPERLAQLGLEHFACAGERQTRSELEAARTLVACDVLLAVRRQLFGRDRTIRLEHDRACTASPQVSLGTPITAEVATAGWLASTFSTSA